MAEEKDDAANWNVWHKWLLRQLAKEPMIYGFSILIGIAATSLYLGKSAVTPVGTAAIMTTAVAALTAGCLKGIRDLWLLPRRIEAASPQELLFLNRFVQRGLRIRTFPGLASRGLVAAGIVRQCTPAHEDGKADFEISIRTYRYITKHEERLFEGL